MMKNYILMLGVASVALCSYAAMASNSATMQVSATINHDASLSVSRDLNIGTITIDPTQTYGIFVFSCDGIPGWPPQGPGGVKAIDDIQIGLLSANVPDLAVEHGFLYIETPNITLGALNVDLYIDKISGNNYCVDAGAVEYDGSVPSEGTYEADITIRYDAE